MNYYQQLIVETTGCTPQEASEVEELIRLEHPTLNGLSKATLKKEAKLCYEAYKYQQSPEGQEYIKSLTKNILGE